MANHDPVAALWQALAASYRRASNGGREVDNLGDQVASGVEISSDEQTDLASGEERPQLEMSSSHQFASWLEETGGSLASTACHDDKVFLIGSNKETKSLSVFERTIERPASIAASGSRLALAAMNQISTFIAAGEGAATKAGYDAVYMPQMAYGVGDLGVSDLGFDADNRIVFTSTLFSCLAAVSDTHSFKPLWQPPFISRLAAERRCHLNGLAMRDGVPAYMTAVAETDVADGWRDNRPEGGIVIDMAANAVVCRGLSMPHSPRLHEGRLYVLNSGKGEFGTVDPDSGTFEPITFCPGYPRGLSFLGGHAVIALSELRENWLSFGLPLQDRLEKDKVVPCCGLDVVDLKTGEVVHWFRLEGYVSELTDVVALPGIVRPTMAGIRTDAIERAISIEPT